MEFIAILVIGFIIYSVISLQVSSKKQKIRTPKIKKTTRAKAAKKTVRPKSINKQPVTADIKTENVSLCYDTKKIDSLPDHIEIQGSEKEPYIVSLKKLSCTCIDFTQKRTQFPKGDIRRICKHQAKAIIKSKRNMKLTTDKRIQAIIRNPQDRGFPVFKNCIKVTFNEPVKGPGSFYIFTEQNNDWLNIILFTDKSFSRYGYNVKTKRWVHRNNPFPDGAKRKYNAAIHTAIKE